MALRGNLSEISLPDIFQLVTFSRKSGVLHIVRSDGARGSVWFRHGEVYFAQSNWRSDPIGERLVRAQRITPKALDRALMLRAAERDNGRRLGEILVAEGYIAPQVIEQFVQEQMQETIFDLMRWDEGEFEFEPLEVSPEEDIGLAVSIENVVMEGSRRLDEWNRIKRKIPSGDVVFKMATAPGEGTFEISLRPVEWNLLLLVDGTMSVTDLARTTGHTDFEVSRILYGLFSAGLLEFTEEEQALRRREERLERETRVAAIRSQRRAEDDRRIQATRVTEATDAPETVTSVELGLARAGEPQVPGTAPPAALAETPPRTVEVPEFLGEDRIAPSPEDMAVLSEMLGAVLGEPAPGASTPAAPSEALRAPAEEPAFIAASQRAAEGTLVPVPSVEDLFADLADLGPESPSVLAATEAAARVMTAPAEETLRGSEAHITDVEEAESPSWTEAPTESSIGSGIEEPPLAVPAAAGEASLVPDLIDQAESEAVPPTQPTPAPEPAPTPAPAAPPTPAVPPVLTGDFAHDLMALGLGEVPAAPSAVEPFEPITPPRTGETATFGTPPIEPTAGQLPSQTDSVLLEEASGVVAPSPVEPMGAGEQIAAPVSVPVPVSVPSPVNPTPGASQRPEVDFSELLESLDLAAEEEQPPLPEPAEVISTQAYLLDSDLGGTDLTDELSALTGADRPNRPTASVNKIPEQGTVGTLHRDSRVDRETVLKIIDGIQNL